MPVGRSGPPENHKAIFPRRNSIEHARWTLRAFKKSRGHPCWTIYLEHARWVFRASRKSKRHYPGNATLSATFMLRFTLSVWCLRVSFRDALSPPSSPPTLSQTRVKKALQLTHRRSFFGFAPQKNREFKLRGTIANSEYFWENVKPIHLLSDKVFIRLGL